MDAPVDKAAFRKLGPDDQIRALRGLQVKRSFTVERDAIDVKNRTVELSIASGAPYERWFGIEILDMQASSIRDGRLRMGAPLLVGHDTADQVGVIEDYEVVGNKLRVLARFGKSARAEEIFQDVQDGIRRNTSVGYVIHDLVLESKTEDTPTYRVTDWEPLEGSIVPVPADPTVGVGRDFKTNISKGTKMENQNEVEERNAESTDYMKMVGSSTKAEIAAALRVNELTKCGEVYADMGGREVAADVIRQPYGTVEDFKRKMLERMRGSSRPLATAQPMDMPYSADHLQAKLRKGSLRAFDDEQQAHRAGMWLKGSILGDRQAQAWCSQNGMRAMGEGINSTGGATVPIEMSSAFIRLVEQYGVFRRNARVWPMGSDQLKIARRKSGLTVFLVGENDAASESTQGWDNVTLSTKKFGTLVRVSNELLEDSAIALADALTQDIALAFATQEDNCGFIGDGTSTYGGMRGLTPIIIDGSHNASKVSAQTGHDTFGEIDNTDLTSLMSALPLYARRNAKFYCSSVAWDRVFSRLISVAGGNRIGTLDQPIVNQYLGYPVEMTQVMPAGATTSYLNQVMILFGDLSLAAAFGDRRQLMVRVSQERYLENDQTAFMCTSRYDIVNHDLGDNTTAGPVVGLIGA